MGIGQGRVVLLGTVALIRWVSLLFEHLEELLVDLLALLHTLLWLPRVPTGVPPLPLHKQIDLTSLQNPPLQYLLYLVFIFSHFFLILLCLFLPFYFNIIIIVTVPFVCFSQLLFIVVNFHLSFSQHNWRHVLLRFRTTQSLFKQHNYS